MRRSPPPAAGGGCSSLPWRSPERRVSLWRVTKGSYGFVCFSFHSTSLKSLLGEYGQYGYGGINQHGLRPLGSYSLVNETAIKIINIQINM